MDLTAQAEELFSRIARDYRLIFERKTYDDGSICFCFSRQLGLKEQIWMCFDGIDEISYTVGDFFSGSACPCPEAFEEFEANARGLFSGKYRIGYGWYWSRLERPVSGGWQVVSSYSGTRWLGFRFRVFINQTDES